MTLDWKRENIQEIADYLLKGEPVVIPTDTLYGVLALANSQKAVEKVYKLKGRNPIKPVIILIADFDDLKRFEIKPTEWQMTQLEKYWPGRFSMILPCDNGSLEYLHRGTETLALRLPNDELLQSLIRLTGPLIAPSANPEGLEPALNTTNANDYFGDGVNLYIDDGIRHGEPSTLLSLINDQLSVLRGELPK